MKTFTILFLFFACHFVSAQEIIKTTTLTATAVPKIVKTNFNNEFPGLQPKWESDEKHYKAVYLDTKTNKKGIIIYDADGKVIRREDAINTTNQN